MMRGVQCGVGGGGAVGALVLTARARVAGAQVQHIATAKALVATMGPEAQAAILSSVRDGVWKANPYDVPQLVSFITTLGAAYVESFEDSTSERRVQRCSRCLARQR